MSQPLTNRLLIKMQNFHPRGDENVLRDFSALKIELERQKQIAPLFAPRFSLTVIE